MEGFSPKKEKSFDQKNAEWEAAFIEFLPKVKKFAEKSPGEITEEELDAMIEESHGIEFVEQNSSIFSTLVNLRVVLFRYAQPIPGPLPEGITEADIKGRPPEETSDELMEKLREIIK